MRLSNIGKNIIVSRLQDKGITIQPSDLDNYIINAESFSDNNAMYNHIVNNYGKLIIQ